MPISATVLENGRMTNKKIPMSEEEEEEEEDKE